MTISIVIPAYNEEKYLSYTLDSLQKLDRKPDEIIVIDGQSTDKTALIAKNFGAKIVQVQRLSIGYARQKGLESAMSEIVVFTDADTIVQPDWLTKIEKAYQDDQVIGVYSGYFVKGGWLPYRLFVNLLQPHIFRIAKLFNIAYASGQNISMRKSWALKAGGFPVNFKSVEDFEMMKRLTKIGKVVFLKDNFVLSDARRGSEGIHMVIRVTKGFFKYIITGKADTFDFPDIR